MKRIRYNIAIPKNIDMLLQENAKIADVPMSEIVRRSICLYDYLMHHVIKNGKLILEDNKGNQKEIIII